MKTGLFIGRFQPFHDGHKRCIEQILEECDACTVLVRCGTANASNPLTFTARAQAICEALPKQTMRGQVLIVPIVDHDYDLTVYIGRDVGYELIQLDAQTESIRATDIRKQLYADKEKKA